MTKSEVQATLPKAQQLLTSREAQQRWAALPIRERLRVLARVRHLLALNPARLFVTPQIADRALPLHRLTSELLPLLAAIRFLEEFAASILKTRILVRKGLPFWLRGLKSEIQRVPFGTILVIGPSNYPLLLPGLQTVQALAAGNSVIWKPGAGGRAIAAAFAQALTEAGLPPGLLTVTDESVAAAEDAIDSGVGKVFLTGSAASGRALLHRLADRVIPCVLELSGCDAVIVLPGADVSRVVQAVTFGLRLNGSATCMAPRRLFLVGASAAQSADLTQRLRHAFQSVGPTQLPTGTGARLAHLLEAAKAEGAVIQDQESGTPTRPVLIENGSAVMEIAQEDIFAPVVTMIRADDVDDLLAAQSQCPFGLTASLFGPEQECRKLAERLEVGSVFINDLIFPSADPRAPFGGRRLSGFGVTQGAEGLLEMTAIKTIVAQSSTDTRHYEPSQAAQVSFFLGFIQTMYAQGFATRLRGALQTAREGRRMRESASRSS